MPSTDEGARNEDRRSSSTSVKATAMYYYDPRDSTGWSKPFVFLAGLIIGVVLGWIFQGIIGTLVRLAIVGLVVVAVFYFFNLWRKSQQPGRRDDDITEADWRDLNSRRRR